METFKPNLIPESELYRDPDLNDEVYSNLIMCIKDLYVEKVKDGFMLASRIVECSIFTYDKDTLKVYVVLEDYEGESYQCSLKLLFNYCEYFSSDFGVDKEDTIDAIKQLVYTRIMDTFKLDFEEIQLFLDNKKNEPIKRSDKPVKYRSGERDTDFWSDNADPHEGLLTIHL